ncbi:hypothetical protein FRB99_003735, partial [Tulasnella sp. 403]
ILTETAIKALIQDAKHVLRVSALLSRGISLPDARHHYPTTKALVEGHLALPLGDSAKSVATRDEFWKRCDGRRVMLRGSAFEMLHWVNYSVNSPWTGPANRLNARVVQLTRKLQALGWPVLDLPNDAVLRNLVGDGPPSLSAEVWEDLRQKLEPTLQRRKEQRLASLERARKQDRHKQRRWDLKSFYNALIPQAVGAAWGLEPYKWLSDREFFCIPAVAALLKEDTPRITGGQFAAIRGDVENVFYERAAESLERLTSILQPTQEARSESHSEVDPTQTTQVRVHAMMKRLSHATSAFWCETCNVLCWFPLVPRFHPPRPKGGHKLGPLHGSRFCPRDQPDLVSRVLESAGLSPEFTLAENHDSQLGLFLCMRCDGRTAQYRTFRELILHYVKAREWYLDATAAVQADPKRAYPRLGGDLSKLPNI